MNHDKKSRSLNCGRLFLFALYCGFKKLADCFASEFRDRIEVNVEGEFRQADGKTEQATVGQFSGNGRLRQNAYQMI